MAHRYNNIPREGFSRVSLPYTHTELDLLNPNPPHASQDVDHSTNASTGDHTRANSEHGRIIHGGHGSVHLVNEPGAARRPSYLPVQKLSPTELVSDPLGKPSKFSVQDWQWEISAAALSLFCFATVVAVLASCNTRSLASWNFVLGITLNTLVAVLSTISRTALLVPVASCMSQLKWIHLVDASRSLRDIQVFEDASRGPWGSLELVWRLHIRTKSATWGSIITILALAMGPFAQQLLSYPSRPVSLDGATFYRSQIYDSQYGTFRTTRGNVNIDATMGPKMQGAIFNGLFNLSSPLGFSCSTGDCRWDEFSTLAVTSACQNVTRSTKVMCEWARGQYCNYTTPAGLFMRGSSFSSSGGVGFYTYFNTTAIKPFTPPGVDSRINGTIVKMAMANMQDPFRLDRPEVLECDMRWCARLTRNMTVINGTFHPGDSKDFSLTGIEGAFDMISTQTRKWYSFNVTADPQSLSIGNRTFSVDRIDSDGIQEFLYEVFTASRNGPFFLPLMNSTDRARTVASISESMSYALAQAPSGTRVDGKVISSELYIRVHWPWIALPLVEVMMGIAFLACTVIHTQRKGVTVWKSSGIVPLLTVMVGWDNDDLRASSWRDIERRSKQMRGQLVPNTGDVQGFYRTP